MSEFDDEPQNSEGHTEAQRAADGLKAQIAAVRARINDARNTLHEHAQREREQRSFKK